MNNLRQIKVIQKALEKQRTTHVFEMGRLTKLLNKKMMSIAKVKAYQKEYSNADNFKPSRTIPTLVKNLHAFNNKISNMIEQEEQEIKRLENGKEVVMNKILQIDHKIKLMAHFETKLLLETDYKNQKIEQLTLDDLSSTMPMRGERD